MFDTARSGDPVDWVDVLIEKASLAKTKAGKDYLRLTLRDKTCAVEAVLWDYDPERHNYPEGAVVKVRGQFGSYNGQLQITVQDFCNSDAQPEAFGKTTRFDVEMMWKDLVERIHEMTEPLTKYVCEEILLKEAFSTLYKRAPAAKKVHNAWYSGLLEHVWSLCQLADSVVAHYQKNYEPQISKDKVLFGLMMHDAGKVYEYDQSPAFAYTAMGTLTPHIVLGPAWVHEKANLWWQQCSHAAAGMTREMFLLERAHLMHLLAAHHGQIEWGSPVVPATIEALLVHHLDNMDSKVMHAWELINGKSGQIPGFSERSYFEKSSYLKYNKGEALP